MLFIWYFCIILKSLIENFNQGLEIFYTVN